MKIAIGKQFVSFMALFARLVETKQSKIHDDWKVIES
jgi:hypothetical protein